MNEEENDGQDVEDEEQDEEQDNNTSSFTSGRKNRGKAKDKAKEGIKKVAKGIVKVAKEYLKLWATHPVAAAIITAIIIIIFLALFLLSIDEDAYKDTKNSTTEYYSSTDLTDANSKKAAEYYNTTGSYLLSTRKDLQEITKKFLETNKTKNAVLYNQMSKTKGSNAVAGIQDIDENRSMYEHILSAEKYNFNKVNWRIYNRSNGKYANMTSGDLQKDDGDNATCLWYPTGDQDLRFFVNMLKPYLQIWYIPFAFAVSYTDSNEDTADINTSFAYEIMKEAYHQIIVDKYEKQTLTKVSTLENYVVSQDTTENKMICDYYNFVVYDLDGAEGNDPVTVSIYKNCKDTTVTNTNILENHVETKDTPEKDRNVKVKRSTTTDICYQLSKALTFDKKYETIVEYTNYNENNTPDYSNKTEEPINEVVPSSSISTWLR